MLIFLILILVPLSCQTTPIKAHVTIDSTSPIGKENDPQYKFILSQFGKEYKTDRAVTVTLRSENKPNYVQVLPLKIMFRIALGETVTANFFGQQISYTKMPNDSSMFKILSFMIPKKISRVPYHTTRSKIQKKLDAIREKGFHRNSTLLETIKEERDKRTASSVAKPRKPKKPRLDKTQQADN